MKQKILLPLEYNPCVRMYQGEAFAMGMVEGNAGVDIKPWLSGKFINCYFQEEVQNKFYISFNDPWTLEDKILTHQCLELSDELHKIWGLDYIDLFKQMLNLGWYPSGRYNEEYIPQKNAFQKRYFYHDFILVGYDDTNNTFQSAGYLEDGHFKQYDIPYENMVKAIETLRTSKNYLQFWKYNSTAEFSFNFKRIISDLSDYINSENSLPHPQYNNKSYGLSAIINLCEYLLKTTSQCGYIDLRYTRGLMDHKYIMNLRIKTLHEHNLLNNRMWLEKSKTVYDIAKKIHLLGLKFIITKQISIAQKLCDMIYEMVSIEKDYLPNVLISLKSNVGDQLL